MDTKQFLISSQMTQSMSLSEAREHLQHNIGQLVMDWRQRNSAILNRESNQLTFLEDFGLRRQANGCIKLICPAPLSPLLREAPIGGETFTHLFVQMASLKIRLLALEELRRLTGRKPLDLRDLGPLEVICDCYVSRLLGDKQFWSDLKPAMNKWLDFLDPEILELAGEARDTIASLATYNLIAANRALWQSMAAQAPGLMPLVGYVCRKRLIRFDQNVFRSLKAYGKRHGLTEKGWKTLCKFSVAHIRILLHFSLEDCFALASHYGKTGLVPDSDLLVNLASYCKNRGIAVGTIPAWFDAAAIKEYQRLENAGVNPSDFANNEYMNALDWLGHYLARDGVPDANQRKAGWKWIMRQSDEWHDAMIEEQARQGIITNHTWKSALEPYQDDGYEVVPLTCSVDLAIEGARMHHCVGSYDQYCLDGRSRIFSIRKDGECLATIELVQNSGAWQLNQCRGPCNKTPRPAIMAVAMRLQERYNTAESK